MVLGAREGGMLIARLDGDVARFTATTHQLLAGLTTAPSPPDARRPGARDVAPDGR
jgi:TetR/AcrR family transcriptional repressor of nem operon